MACSVFPTPAPQEGLRGAPGLCWVVFSARCPPSIRSSPDTHCNLFWDPELTGTYLRSKLNHNSLPQTCLFVASHGQGTVRRSGTEAALPLRNVVEVLESVGLTQESLKAPDLGGGSLPPPSVPASLRAWGFLSMCTCITVLSNPLPPQTSKSARVDVCLHVYVYVCVHTHIYKTVSLVCICIDHIKCIICIYPYDV